MSLSSPKPARLLGLYQSFSFVLGAAYLGFFAYFGASLSLLGPLTFLVLTCLSIALTREGFTDWAARILCVGLWCAPSWCAATTGGLESPLVVWLLPHILMSAVLLGWRAAFLAGTSSILVVLGMTGLQDFLAAANEFPPGTSAEMLRLLCAVSSIATITFYGVTFTREAEVIRQEADQAQLELQRVREAHDQHSIVAITDPKGRITEVNQLFCDISKYGREELIGQDHRIVNSGLHDKAFWKDAWDTIQRGETWSGEIKNKAKDGSFYWVHSSFVPVLDSDGTILEYIAIRTDVTKQKEAEAAARQAQNDAEQAARVKAEFLATMSHEIRTPMNGVTGMARLLSDTAMTDEQTQYLEALISSSSALVTLIDDVLDYSKLEAGKLEIDVQPFALREVLEGIDELMSVKAEDKGIHFAAIVDRDVPDELLGDAGRIRQVLINLANNAVKFTPVGQVTLRVSSLPDPTPELCGGETGREDRHLVRFEIQDTGIGISDRVVDKLFTPFTQADSSTTRKFGGTGLGLSISKELCHLMGGELAVESTLGQGSTFSFAISLERSRGMQSKLPRLEKTVVLVSEPGDCREVIVEGLAFLGTEVLEVTHPEEALSCLDGTERAVDAVLYRPNLEAADAEFVVEALSAKLRARGVELFVILPIRELKRMGTLFDHGATGVLSEPIRLARLTRELQAGAKADGALAQAEASMDGSLEGNVLLVDDNKINLTIASRVLKKFGLTVTTRDNGQAAMEAILDGDYDLVLMDCQMPIMDGYEATRQLRQLGGATSFENLPIIALTAGAMKGDRDACKAAGMNVHVAKPIVPEVLHRVLQEYLRQGV